MLPLTDSQSRIGIVIGKRNVNGTRDMAQFLGVSIKVLQQVICSGRLPLRCRLSLGNCRRWSVLELLEWVEAGCPRVEKWMKMRGGSGSARWEL
jgi:hypothetical protein